MITKRYTTTPADYPVCVHAQCPKAAECLYDRRHGTVAMPPEEQALVLQTLKNAGVVEEMQFDSYVDAINWYD